MPLRMWKSHVLPPSVGTGMEVARSGTSCEPAVPLTRFQAVSPSLVITRICQFWS